MSTHRRSSVSSAVHVPRRLQLLVLIGALAVALFVAFAASSATSDAEAIPIEPIGCPPICIEPIDLDDDDDGVLNFTDNCPSVANPTQANYDGDSMGDACDSDDDNDGRSDILELLGGTNPRNADTDGDGVGDSPDNCRTVSNADQLNTDGASDGGNACDADDDNDGVPDASDNCPLVSNADQANSDGDAAGNACDAPDPAPVSPTTPTGGSTGGSSSVGSTVAAQSTGGGQPIATPVAGGIVTRVATSKRSACAKLTGKKRSACVRRENALRKCAKVKKGKKRAACVKKATRIRA